MDYGEVLSRAWQIVWKHKILWIFGILAGCGSYGNLGRFSSSYRTDYVPSGVDDFFLQFERIPDWQIAALIGGLILVVLVLVLLATFLTTVGKIGVIQGAQKADQGALSMKFGELFSGSLPFFWRVFLLNLLFGLAFAALVFVLVIVFAFGAILTLGIALICMIPVICLLVPVSWLLFVVLEQANIAIVVDNLGIIDGLRRGWQVFRDNLGAIIVMALILGIGVALIGGLIIGAPLFLIAVPVMSTVLLGSDSAVWGGLLITGLCFLAYLPFWLVLNGILTAYIESAWTLTYMRLTRRPTAIEPVAEPETV
jgi:hypothetical protein